MEEVKIAALGESDIMLIFKAIGADVYPVESTTDTGDADDLLKKIIREGYGIIFMTETVAAEMKPSRLGQMSTIDLAMTTMLLVFQVIPQVVIQAPMLTWVMGHPIAGCCHGWRLTHSRYWAAILNQLQETQYSRQHIGMLSIRLCVMQIRSLPWSITQVQMPPKCEDF